MQHSSISATLLSMVNRTKYGRLKSKCSVWRELAAPRLWLTDPESWQFDDSYSTTFCIFWAVAYNRCQETDVLQSKYCKTAAEELILCGSHWKPLSANADTKSPTDQQIQIFRTNAMYDCHRTAGRLCCSHCWSAVADWCWRSGCPFSTCRLFWRLLNGLPLDSCNSAWEQTTFFHNLVGVSEKSYDRNSDATCLVWYTIGCRWATGDTAGTAGHLSSFWQLWPLHASGSIWSDVVCVIHYLTECGHFWLTERSRLQPVLFGVP